MPPESNLSKRVVNGLRQFGNIHSVIRIESGMTMRGIPDINYFFSKDKSGWCELKYIPGLPVTKTSLPKYTSEQRLFAKRRTESGEKVFLLIQAGQEHFLFNSYDVKSHMSKQDFYNLSKKSWGLSINFLELYELL